MRTVSVVCPSCGAQLDVDLKLKYAVCEFCNRKVVLTSDDLEASELVDNNIGLAKTAFFDRNFKNIESHCQKILEYDNDNIVALFLFAYIREFYSKVRGQKPIGDFFVKADLSQSSDNEISTVLTFISAQPLYYVVYLDKIKDFAGKIEDEKLAGGFMDKLLSDIISHSKSSTWFPGGMEEMKAFFASLSLKYNIVRAYLALYNSTRQFEDSPLVSGYKLITRAKLFHDEYVGAVKEIVDNMPDSDAKTKISTALSAVEKKMAEGIKRQTDENERIDNGGDASVNEILYAADEEPAEEDN